VAEGCRRVATLGMSSMSVKFFSRGSITRKIALREHSDLTLYSAQTVWFRAFFSVWGVSSQAPACHQPSWMDAASAPCWRRA